LKGIVIKNKEFSDKFIPNILKDIGSQGALVIDALKVTEKSRFNAYCAMQGFKEREAISEILNSAKTTWYLTSWMQWGDYSESDFTCIMDKLVERRNNAKEPKISLMMLTTTCRKQAIKYFSNQGWLFYDPSMQQVSVRNKIFLDVYEASKSKDKNIAELKRQLADMKISCGGGLDELGPAAGCDKVLLEKIEDELEKAYNSPK
jgi:hypothetical protein